METVKVVIGAGFGDEGKGLMTDYFCHQSKNTLNVRFNGGAQAGHTVVTPEGERNIFHSLGSGHCDVYFGPEFILNPLMLLDELKKVGTWNHKIYIDERCQISFYADMMANQKLEEALQKENKNHGSCGCGIYETVKRGYWSGTTISVEDATDRMIFYGLYRNCMKHWIDIDKSLEQYCDLDTDWDIIQTLLSMDNVYRVSKMPSWYNQYVFEGAQGLMLDQNNKEYYPHLTPSNTGMKNVKDILVENNMQGADIEVVYVTRSYATRHGAGLLKLEVKDKSEISKDIVEKTNVTNKYQQNFRFGYFNPVEVVKAVKKDMTNLDGLNAKVKMAITHLDQTDGKLVCPNTKIETKDFIKNMIGLDAWYEVDGETRNDVHMLSL